MKKLTDKLKKLRPTTDVPVQNEPEGEFAAAYRLLQMKEADGYYKRELTIPGALKHGEFTVREAIQLLLYWQEQNRRHPLNMTDEPLHEWRFFDTETTGLSGGAGTTIFMYGIGRIVGDHLVVTQYVLPTPAGEKALLERFKEDVDDKPLITFNGKSYDWPLVETRYALQRTMSAPTIRHHVDLYHAAKRLWKHRKQSLKLVEVEKQHLGYERIDDVPGFLAPMIYFQYVKTGNPELLEGVLKHNAEDIVSLVCLFAKMAATVLDEGKTPGETLAVARWYDDFGNRDVAEETYEKVDESEFQPEAIWRQSLLLKRKKDERVVDLWQRLLTSPFAAKALLELAKWMEHVAKDYGAATRYALELADVVADEEKPSVEHRLARLARKEAKR